MSTIEPAPPQRVQLSLPLTRPVLIWVLLGINILMFIAETLLGGSENSTTLVKLGAKVNVLIAMGEYWRLIAPMFLHIGLPHILFNSYALYAIGPEVESLFGRARFLTLYLISGIAGNVMSYAFTPNLSAGASTAIFGLIGAEMVFFYRQRKTLGAFGQRRLVNILGIIAINLFIGMSGAVDNFGHAGGLVSGVVVGWLLCPDYQVGYGLDGQPRVHDRNSLLRELPGVVLLGVLLIVATGAVTLREVKQPQFKLEQGIQKLLQDDYAGAAKAFEETVQASPDLPDAYFYLGLTYAQLNRRSEAMTNLRRFLVLEPTGARAEQARQLLAQIQ